MDRQEIISELTQELNRDHVGGRAGRFIELAIGLFLLAGGTFGLACSQGICGLPQSSLPPGQVFLMLVFGCAAVSRSVYYAKWKRAIDRIARQP